MTDSNRYERLLARLSARFSGIPTSEVDGEIDRALEWIVDFFGTDRATLLAISPNTESLTITHSWARSGDSPARPQTPVESAFPWYHARLRRGEALRFTRLPDELPVDAVEERAYVASLPMLSHLAVPLLVDGKWVCALLTATAHRHRSWTDQDVERAQIAGQILANAIYRRNVERELREHLDEVRRLQRRLEAENTILRETTGGKVGFEAIAGRSFLLRDVVGQAARVAKTRASVLLLGETGTGKELLARAIHGSSDRAEKPLVQVNCAALPDSLVESELFGHEKGAFTGATSAKPGRFELADGGTLFLDEIGELPLDAQVKLLRVLEDGEVQRLGAVRSRRVDVRIVAATNRNLEHAIAEGRFREDLYYRLAVFPIRLPSLRARREDIPLLVWELIQRRQDEVGRRIEHVSEESMKALMGYSWPGNVRELGNIVERALILSEGPVLEFDGLIPFVRASSDRSERRDVVERAHLIRVLESCHWRINGPGNAAAILGMHPSTLRSRLKRLGVERPPVA